MDLTRRLPLIPAREAREPRPRKGSFTNLLLSSRHVDAPLTWLVARGLFPLSRLWAAAEVAGSDPERFAAAVPLGELPKSLVGHVTRVLRRIEAARQRSADADAAWEGAFFGATRIPEAELIDLERARAKAARALVLQRARLLWSVIRMKVPSTRYDLPDGDEIATAYGDYLEDPGAAYVLPRDLPKIQRSHSIPGRVGRDYWLRFPAPSPRMGGHAWARVHEPAGVSRPPTFTFANGIAAEFDQIDAPPAELLGMVADGVRVIEMEAPFHGRRRNRGEFSGEPYFSRLPLGAIDLFTTMAKELGIVAGWARTLGSPAVGFGGVSLGAFVSQLAAAHAGRWPERCRPDILFVIVCLDRVSDLPFTSRLAEMIRMPEAAAAAGLTGSDAARWSGFVDAPKAAPLPPEDIIAVLGKRDRICPYAVGRAQMERWGVPPDNLYIRPGGHFSTPFGMLRDGRAVARLTDKLLAGASTRERLVR